MTEPIRILHVLGNLNLGGAESRTMDLYRHVDRERVQFDFLVHTDEACYFDNEIETLGGHIYRVPRFRIYNFFSYRKALKEFFKAHNNFKAVQGHMTSTASVYLPIAKKAGIPVTIAHARSAGVDRGLKGRVTMWMRRNLAKKADYLFSCSELAGRAVFGDKSVELGKTIFIPNAIDCGVFSYDEVRRAELRKELGVDDKYVIGHVGRFHYAKNHEYLLQIFTQLCQIDEAEKLNKDFVLMLLGDGEGLEQAKKLAKQLGIFERVLFLGNRANAYDYYQAMDYFVYPSRFEGLPGTMVEAQVSGLRCLMSDSICKEVEVTELVKTMSIAETPQKWAWYIVHTADYERVSHMKEMQEAGFDVNAQACKMMNFYETGILE